MVEQVEKTTMPPATLTALKASIKHWQENVNAERPEDAKFGISNCPLCDVFYGEGCYGVPLATKRNADIVKVRHMLMLLRRIVVGKMLLFIARFTKPPRKPNLIF